MAVKNEIALVTQENIRNKIYTIRGQRVMLDSDLAAIYGYTTKVFNQQIARNKEKFEEDFMFPLTLLEETEYLSRSQFVTSIMQTKGMKGGRTYYPYAFTEQGIYNQSLSSCGLR
ncbi:MAG: ORF6N domain-containing protein [Synergistaceae bacterium]|nr:ORF6N domain-containing protein [Candidatus Equadaptatus faecalis]